MYPNAHHHILILGGGTAGITVAARLNRAGTSGVAIIEPSDTHYYQPLWTLVGAGAATAQSTARRQQDFVPASVTWIKDAAAEIDPDSRSVTTVSGARLTYDFLVVATGVVFDWEAIPGLREAVATPHASTNYTYDLAPKTWELIRNFRGGTALFHMPGTPIKCPGAPQKIMYLAADYFRRNRVSAKVIYGSATPSIYGVKEYAAVLNRVVERYGIDARFNHELVEVRPQSREAVFVKKNDSAGERATIPYDLLHVIPPQVAPDFIRKSPLAVAAPAGWVDVDQYTMRHKQYANVFALGDVAGTPNAKTGAAVMKQAPVMVANLLSAIAERDPVARYDGYVACPITTAYGKLLLCEFDYTGKPTPTVPLIDTMGERYETWLLKRYGLPWLYWNVMLKGRDVPFLKLPREVYAAPAAPREAPYAAR
jgi:sulfide:quinone oxidoreductase